MRTEPVIALVGAGHANLHVAARARQLAERGARVVLIDPGAFWYSGLATGMLGGMYTPEDDCIDPERLIEACGGEFIQDEVLSADPELRRLYLAGGDTLDYDWVSLNVGSRVAATAIPGLTGEPECWTVKPVARLWRLREYLTVEIQAGQAPRVAVVGGGPTGSEVAANLAALGRRCGRRLPVSLVSHSERLIKQAPAGASRSLARRLRRLGIDLYLQTRVAGREPGTLLTEAGDRIGADVVVLAVGLEANPLAQAMGLPSHPRDGLRVTAALHSIGDERVFAAGDCASMDDYTLPKLGVFGVRQAEFIQANLLAQLEGRAPMRYTPQKRFLAILNLGDGSALATWGPLWWRGRASFRLKDHIDRRFMKGYRQLYAN